MDMDFLDLEMILPKQTALWSSKFQNWKRNHPKSLAGRTIYKNHVHYSEFSSIQVDSLLSYKMIRPSTLCKRLNVGLYK